jgi:hypothetical protein
MLTFRVIRMPADPHLHGQTRYVAVAWNYDYAQLMSTRPRMTYTEARAELDGIVSERGCALRWFDGEYECLGDGAQITPVATPTVARDVEQDNAHQA